MVFKLGDLIDISRKIKFIRVTKYIFVKRFKNHKKNWKKLNFRENSSKVFQHYCAAGKISRDFAILSRDSLKLLFARQFPIKLRFITSRIFSFLNFAFFILVSYLHSVHAIYIC